MRGFLESVSNYQRRRMEGEISSSAIDGTDSVGKETVTNRVANILSDDFGQNVLIVSYPDYERPWGRFLRHLLSEDDENLSLKERMVVYALNRLETLSPIVKTVDEMGAPARILFDRYPTSSILTLAYYNADKDDLNQVDIPVVLESYDFIWEGDKFFIDTLAEGRGITNIHILDVPSNIALGMADERMKEDAHRVERDKYEQPKVQDLAAAIFQCLGRMFGEGKIQDRFFMHQQMIEDKGDQRRKTPDEIALEIISEEKIVKKLGKGVIRKLDPNLVDTPIEVVLEMERLIGIFDNPDGSNRLRDSFARFIAA